MLLAEIVALDSHDVPSAVDTRGEDEHAPPRLPCPKTTTETKNVDLGRVRKIVDTEKMGEYRPLQHRNNSHDSRVNFCDSATSAFPPIGVAMPSAADLILHETKDCKDRPQHRLDCLVR
jgi:hypothetical protein